MTHPIYEPIQLTAKSLTKLRGIYASLACTIEIADKRCREDWMKAILEHQSGHTNIATELCETEVSTQDLDKQVHVISYL
ncbi:MAG: hypothetical protein PUP93_33115 [Rhizonema sp. NSF051]|nr:hypothetical protein [Rhizonema sp. NSF051]